MRVDTLEPSWILGVSALLTGYDEGSASGQEIGCNHPGDYRSISQLRNCLNSMSASQMTLTDVKLALQMNFCVQRWAHEAESLPCLLRASLAV